VPALERIDFTSVSAQGFAFQVELSWRAHQAGLRTVEVPITFAERERGTSKMSPTIIGEALWRITMWGVQDRQATVRRGLHGTATGQVRWP
jgi:dolichol-phosphate mannosyltransferase